MLVSKWFVVGLCLLLLPCLNVLTVEKVSAQKCLGTWDIVSLSGIKSSYQPGEYISGSFMFKLNNPSSCPRCFQQILVGIVDQFGVKVKTIVPVCVYNGIPKVCPDYTPGFSNLSFQLALDPGTYRIIACNYYQNSCAAAQKDFPAAPNYTKELASITVSVPSPPVITTFTASKTSVNTGQESTLQWNVIGATSVSINQGIGKVSSSGTKVATPTATTVYTLTATNNAGSTTATTKVTVTTPPPNPPTPNPPIDLGKIVGDWIEQMKVKVPQPETQPPTPPQIQPNAPSDNTQNNHQQIVNVMVPFIIYLVVFLLVIYFIRKLVRDKKFREKIIRIIKEIFNPSPDLFNRLCDAIELYDAPLNTRNEQAYQFGLFAHLQTKFPSIKAEVPLINVRGEIDFAVGNIGIEIKGNSDNATLSSLADQIGKYSDDYNYIIVVLFMPRYDISSFKRMKHQIDSSYPKLKYKFIIKGPTQKDKK